jgi:hypothetical protein
MALELIGVFGLEQDVDVHRGEVQRLFLEPEDPGDARLLLASVPAPPSKRSEWTSKSSPHTQAKSWTSSATWRIVTVPSSFFRTRLSPSRATRFPVAPTFPSRLSGTVRSTS